jgi:hypothetical protein
VVDLTTVERVKALMGYLPENDDADQVLASLVRSVSAEMERALDRKVEIAERIALLSPEAGQRVFPLHAWPILSVASVTEDYTHRAFTGDTAVVLEADVDFAVDSVNGLLHVDRWALRAGKSSLQVVYTGGMATDTDGFVVDYPDLAAAADAQVVYQFRQRESIGKTNMQVQGVGVGFTPTAKGFQDQVEAAIARYRRVILG